MLLIGSLMIVGIAISFILLSRSLAFDRLFSVEELRVQLLPTLFTMLKDYMPWGSGFGSFEHAYKIYEPSELLRPTYLNQAHIDWQLYSIDEYGAVLNNGKLQMSAIRGSGDLFARQLIRLPEKATMSVMPDDEISSDSRMLITVSCAQALRAAPQPIKIPLKGKIENLQINNAKSECSFYWIDINGRASENGDSFDIALDSTSIR